MKVMRLGLATLAALAVLLVLVGRLGSGERRGAVAPDSAAANPTLRATFEQPAESGVEAPAAARDEVAAPPPAPIEPTPEPAKPVLALHGRVIVDGVDGRELGDLDGSFGLFVWRGEQGELLDVGFAAGRWTKEIQDPEAISALSIGRVEVGSRIAMVTDPTERVGVPEIGELVVRARFAPALTLEVIDAASGAHLSGISLVREVEFGPRGAPHPGLDIVDRIVAESLASPIALDSIAAKLTRWYQAQVHVGAPGYAWASIKLELSVGGTRGVALERGAELVVLVRGADPAAHALLRLRPEGPDGPLPPLMDTPLDSDGQLEITGLAPGKLRVRAEVGEWFGEPLVLGETSVELAAGERRQVELVLEQAPPLEVARAGGVVYVAKAWSLERPTVTLELLDTPLGGRAYHHVFHPSRLESSREGFDAFRWASGDLQVGRYELALFKPPFSAVVELPRGGRDDFELVVPAPVELVVRVVDDATGKAVATDDLKWHPREPEGVSGFGLEPAQAGAAPGEYVIRAPAVPIELMLWGDDYLPYDAEVDLTTGVREHTVRLQRACSILLTLRAGESTIPVPPEWDGFPRAITGSGETSLTSFGTSRRFVVTEPGAYELDPPKVSGYRKPPLQRIEVFAGRETEHVIELELEHP
jgi:hypothetical protein